MAYTIPKTDFEPRPRPAPGEVPAHAPRQAQQTAALPSQARPYGRPTTPVGNGVRAYRGIGRGPSAAPLHGQGQHRPQQTTRPPAAVNDAPTPGDNDLPF